MATSWRPPYHNIPDVVFIYSQKFAYIHIFCNCTAQLVHSRRAHTLLHTCVLSPVLLTTLVWNRLQAKITTLLFPKLLFLFVVKESYGSQYQKYSMFKLMWGVVFHRLRSSFFVFFRMALGIAKGLVKILYLRCIWPSTNKFPAKSLCVCTLFVVYIHLILAKPCSCI
jgi:hypothetical protein